MLPLFSTLALLSSCAGIPTSVEVDDHVLYYQKQASDADFVTVIHFLQQGTQTLSKSQWGAISEGQVCMPLADWGQINKMISEFCSAPQINCDYQINGQPLKEALNDFFLRLSLTSGVAFSPIE